MRQPADDLGIDLEALPTMPLAKLRVLWAQHMGRAPPPAQKRLLIRELAWTVQERRYGGLDPQTQKLLDAAVRAAKAELRRRAEGKPPLRHVKAATPAQLPTSTRLVRSWGGVSHEVLVLDNGKRFAYRGTEYRSLSEIARLITGARWSGPRFFGLAGTPGDKE